LDITVNLPKLYPVYECSNRHFIADYLLPLTAITGGLQLYYQAIVPSRRKSRVAKGPDLPIVNSDEEEHLKEVEQRQRTLRENDRDADAFMERDTND
jgi:hypothetical protein